MTPRERSVGARGPAGRGRRLFGGWLTGASLTLAAVGCGEAGPETGTGFTVRDSAGVAVAETVAPRWTREGTPPARRLRPGDEPALDLTTVGAGPAHEFDDVADATLLDDGRIVVAEDGSDRVRVYAPTGELLAELGREGDGPGEFRRLDAVHAFRGDSILAYDFWLGRATILTPDGRLGRVVTLSDPGDRVQQLVPVGGDFIGVTWDLRSTTELEGPYRMPVLLRRFSPDGEPGDTIHRMPGFEGFQFAAGDAAPLFGKRGGHVANHPEGLVTGTADSLAFDIRAPDGTLLRAVRVPGFDLSLSPEEVEAERRAREPSGTGIPPELLQALRDANAAMPAPSARPGYDELLSGPDGSVWARVYRGVRERDGSSAWRVFSPEGEWLGTIDLPERFRLLEVGRDHLLGVRRDELDVERVQLLPLFRDPET